MRSLPGYIPNFSVAEDIASRLSAVADRLAYARDAEEFVTAIEDHRRIWRGMRQAAPRLNYKISDRLIDFSLTETAHKAGGVSDQEVEAFIKIDRSLSAALSTAEQLPAE